MVNSPRKTGRHTVTAIPRNTSQKFPEGVMPKAIDYDKPEALLMLGGHAHSDAEMKLIHAAGGAGVKWTMPNEWCPWDYKSLPYKVAWKSPLWTYVSTDTAIDVWNSS